MLYLCYRSWVIYMHAVMHLLSLQIFLCIILLGLLLVMNSGSQVRPKIYRRLTSLLLFLQTYASIIHFYVIFLKTFCGIAYHINQCASAPEILFHLVALHNVCEIGKFVLAVTLRNTKVSFPRHLLILF
uniref:Uncharacterized protein n=1 Tax=mine drainage metagenome TaxID=410659 RepID=E6QB49_9ZZZZ